MSDWAAVGSAVFAAVGLLFAGWQLLLLNRQADHDRRVALEGVVVSWRPLESPDHADDDDDAQWRYEIAAHNPGRLPIDNVQIRLVFPCDLRRVHYSGRFDQPAPELTLATPVLAGGDRRLWNRRLRIAYNQKDHLTATYAEISFRDIDNGEHTNRWPRSAGGEMPEHTNELG